MIHRYEIIDFSKMYGIITEDMKWVERLKEEISRLMEKE